jgi:hypothetical protein
MVEFYRLFRHGAKSDRTVNLVSFLYLLHFITEMASKASLEKIA